MEFHVKHAAETAILEEIAEAFRDLYPAWYETFLTVIREEEQHLVKQTGLSKEGTMMTFCKIPGPIFSFIKIQMRKHGISDDWFRDEANYRLLCKVWSDIRVKNKPTSRLFKGAKE